MKNQENKKYRYKNWPHAVLIGIDQLGNAIAGGYPVTTISARVGFFSRCTEPVKGRVYWRCLEKLIDFTFYPLDGSGHCQQALANDVLCLYRHGNDFMRMLLGVSMVFINPIIALVLYPLVIFLPHLSFKNRQ